LTLYGCSAELTFNKDITTIKPNNANSFDLNINFQCNTINLASDSWLLKIAGFILPTVAINAAVNAAISYKKADLSIFLKPMLFTVAA